MKVIVNVPAAMTYFGPALNSIGLGLALHLHLEMLVRRDDQLEINISGEGQGQIQTGFRNPVVRAATRLFQKREMAPAGLSVNIENRIPLNIGLDTMAALTIGGLVGANNLVEKSFTRNEIMHIAMELGISPEIAVTTLMGGLNLSVVEPDGNFFFNSLEPPPLRLVIVAPELSNYANATQNALPKTVALTDAMHNLSRLPFLVDALLEGNHTMIAKTLDDRLYQAAFTQHIPGYQDARDAAIEAGAAAVTLVGQGPAVMAFAEFNHTLVANAMVNAFQAAGIAKCDFWTIGLDTQGVTVSMAQ